MLALTHDNQYYRDNFSRRSTLIDEYVNNMLSCMKHMFPSTSESILEAEIRSIIKKRYVPTNVQSIDQPEPGIINIVDSTLLEATNELNENILTPYGATYVPAEVRKSLFVDYIEGNQADRKAIKRDMLIAEANNDKETMMIKHLRQMNIKININALSGVMLSNVAFRSAINYNAVTATARFNIMLAYSSVEMMLESNYYFHSEDKAINWIANLLRIYPGDAKFTECIDKYKLRIPDTDHVITEFAIQVNHYSKFSENIVLREFISKLSPLEVAYIYYAQNLKRIIQDNESFREYFDSMFDINNVKLIDGEIPKIDKLPDELVITIAMVILADEVGILFKDKIDKEYPELARKIYSLYVYLELKLLELELLFDILLIIPIVPSEIVHHKNILRKSVLLSDTDSILFTTASWIKWYTGDIRITNKASNINVTILALMLKIFEHLFAYTSASMNVSTTNMRKMALKNEFMYDVFMRTPISKHYAGYVKYREGIRLSPYKFDIKGKNFKGSDLCKTTTKHVDGFIRSIFDNFLETYKIDPEELISNTIDFEQRIKKSIGDGDVTFLSQIPIKLAKDYKTPDASNFLYYTMWMEVFAGYYPAINPPQKCKTLPVKPLSLKYMDNLDLIKEKNQDIYNKLIVFLRKYPKRIFDRVIIPMDIPIPTELRELADYRKVCLTNCYSLYLILKSFNIVVYPSSDNSQVLFSDMYPYLLKEV